jgi:site-specific DNA recombinase
MMVAYSVSRVSFINDNLIMYLSNGGEPIPDGTEGGSPSYFVSRRKLMISPVNIRICM